MNVKKNQHYVTSGLLQFFVNEEDFFYEFLVKDLDKDPYPSKPDSAMSARYVYEHDLLRVNVIENYLEVNFDAESPNVVRKIISEIENSKQSSGDLEKVRGMLFSALEIFLTHYYRSGALLAEFSTDGEDKKIELMLRKILDKGYIKLLAKSIENFYKFAIIESDRSFLISDQYVSTAALRVKSQFVEVSNRNLGLKETIILIPLSSSYYAVFWNSSEEVFKENEINRVNDLSLETINRVIVNNSYEKCVGEKEAICKIAQKKFYFQSSSKIITTGLNFVKKKEVFWNEREMMFWISFRNHEAPEKFDSGRNDTCPCGSGHKYEKCHGDYCEWWDDLVETWGNGNFPFIHIGNERSKKRYVIEGVPIIEGPIDQH